MINAADPDRWSDAIKRVAFIAALFLATFPALASPAMLPGDIDSNGTVDLMDAIAALRLMAGGKTINPPSVPADVDGDERIGLAEALYALQCAARLRNNHAPVLAGIGDHSVDADALLTFTVSATDVDKDTVSYGRTGLPASARLDPATGVLTWKPDFAESGTYQVTFIADDGYGGTDSQTVRITVNNMNRPPRWDPIGSRTVAENERIVFSVLATDDDGDPLTYSVSQLPIGASFDPLSRTFSWTPGYTQSGVHRVTFTAADTHRGSAVETIEITVNDRVPEPILAVYLPLTIGNTWHFEGVITSTVNQPVHYSNTLAVTGHRLIRGVEAAVLSESNAHNAGGISETYLVQDESGITLAGNGDPADRLTAQLAPYRYVPLPLQPDNRFVQYDRRNLDYAVDLDQDGVTESADIRSEVTIGGPETVTVPVGTFTDCLKTVTNTVLAVTLSGNGNVVKATSVRTAWFAPGIGFLKSVTSTTAGNITEYVTESLTGCAVNGTSRGVVQEIPLAQAVAPNDSDESRPGRPSVGTDGNHHLVVTQRVNGTSASMVGTLISPAGEVVKNFTVFDEGSSRSAVAFDGVNYLVVSVSRGHIRGQRVTTAGVVLDGPSGFPISSDLSPDGPDNLPVVAFDGVNYLVVWSRYDNDYVCSGGGCIPKGHTIYAARVSTAGEVLDEFRVGQPLSDQVFLSLAYNGTHYLAVWRDSRNASYPLFETDIYGARITTGGVVLDPGGIAISTASGSQETPQVASDGVNFFVSWLAQRSVLTEGLPIWDISGTRIDRDGKLLDGLPAMGGIPINTASYRKYHPSMAFTGRDYFIVWAVGDYPNDPPVGIYAARVSTDGLLLGGDPGMTAGLSISGLPADRSRFIYPVISANTVDALVTWVNLGATSKDIRAAMVYP